MCTTTQRLLSTLILSLWMAPVVGALGVGLHLVFEHHHGHEAEHQRELEDLVQTVAHGHHHDAQATPDHEHAAPVPGVATPAMPSAAPVATLAMQTTLPTARGERSPIDRSLRRGPPDPLFTVHCSLLL